MTITLTRILNRPVPHLVTLSRCLQELDELILSSLLNIVDCNRVLRLLRSRSLLTGFDLWFYQTLSKSSITV